MNAVNKVTPKQSASLVASTIIGVGVLTLPRVAAEYAKQCGWIAVIAGALAAAMTTWIITALAKRFPGQSIVQYSALILGSRNSRRNTVGKAARPP